MSRQSDLILFGPRLAIALSAEAARLVSGLAWTRMRDSDMRDSDDGASGQGAGNADVPASGADPALEAGSPGPDLLEVIPDLPQAVDGGFPEPSGKDRG